MWVRLSIGTLAEHGNTKFPVLRDYTYYLQEGWDFTKQSNGGTAEFSFTLEERFTPEEEATLLQDYARWVEAGSLGTFSVPHPIHIPNIINHEVILNSTDDLGTPIFGGILTKCKARTKNPFQRYLECTALGWEHLLDLSTFSYSYTGPVSHGDILGGNESEGIPSCFDNSRNNFNIPDYERGNIKWNINRFSIKAGLPDVERRSYEAQNIRQLFSKFSIDSGNVWGVKSNKEPYFWPPATEHADIQLLDEHADFSEKKDRTNDGSLRFHKFYPFHNFDYVLDVTKYRNHVILRGAQTRSEKNIKEEYTADQIDSNNVLVLGRNFIEWIDESTQVSEDTLRVSVNGLQVSVGSLGTPLKTGSEDDPDTAVDVEWIIDGINSILRFSPVVFPISLVEVEGREFRTLIEEDEDEEAILQVGRLTEIINDPSINTRQAARYRLGSELYRLGESLEVISLSILVDTGP